MAGCGAAPLTSVQSHSLGLFQPFSDPVKPWQWEVLLVLIFLASVAGSFCGFERFKLN